jgi:UDP-glucose 4-epimerase
LESKALAIFVSGGAGFIGANLIDRLLGEGAMVVAVDNFVRGARTNLERFAGHNRFHLIEADLAQADDCARAFDEALASGPIEEVWHLAANSDIPAGVADPTVDLRDTFLTTFEILRQMRRVGTKRLHFSSTSAVYGDHGDTELTEDIGPLFPISNYGAMKLASEAQAAAAAEAFLDQALIYRFPNVVGVPATHGVILDFVRRLKSQPAVLQVLGDGTQRKPYLHVSELLDAMLLARTKADGGVSAYNIGPVDAGMTVRWIAEQVTARVSPGARIEFGQGSKGWVGDVSRFRYSTSRIQALGWRPTLGSEQALTRAIDEIAMQEGV